MQAPRELVLLNGSPGSGKTANAAFVERSRNLNRTVCISSLLGVQDKTGVLVSDAQVLDVLLGALLDPKEGACASGAVIDGFPRSPVQVELLICLYDKVVPPAENFASFLTSVV
jgi:adenylate kinase family enzyme